MTPSPRRFSTIAVAAVVLSATLSVLLPPDPSFAQSSSRALHLLTSKTDLFSRLLVPVAQRACDQVAYEGCKFSRCTSQTGTARYAALSQADRIAFLKSCFNRCQADYGCRIRFPD